MGLHRIAQNGRVHKLKRVAISATRTAGNHNPPPVSSIVPYTSYPLTLTIDTPPPCMIQRNMLYYALSRGEKGKRGANTYPTDRKGVKK